MEKLANKLRSIRVVFRHSRPLVKVVALCVVVFSTLALLTMQDMILSSRDRAAELEQQALTLSQENQSLTEKIDGINSVAGIQELAREELGLVDPGTVIIEVEPQQ